MRTGNRQQAKRVAALALLLCFLMVALLSGAFILTHANHQHDHLGVGGECAVCAQIHSLENQLKQFGAASGGVSFGLAGLFAVTALLCCVSVTQYATPVRLKIRLNN